MNNNDLQQIESLILRHLTDGLNAEEQRRLAEALQSSPEARKLLSSHLQVEASMLRLARGQAISTVPAVENRGVTKVIETDPAPKRSARTRVRRYIYAVTAAVALLVTLLLASFVNGPRVANSDGSSRKPVTRSPIAYVTRSIGTTWTNATNQNGNNFAIEANTSKEDRTVAIDEGIVEVEFASGATVILEGPATLEVVSADAGVLHRGRLRSIVPPEAFGFSIASRKKTIVDLGTEFGLEVDKGGATEVHVFDGEVEVFDVADSSGKAQLVAAGEALRFEQTGESSVLLADASFFVGKKSLEIRSVAFVNEVDDQLAALQQRVKDIAQLEKKRRDEIRNSDELKRFRRKIETTRKAIYQAAKNTKAFKGTEQAREEARNAVEALVDRKLAEQGRDLIEQRNQLDAKIDELRTEMGRLSRSKLRRKTIDQKNGKAIEKRDNQLQKEVRATKKSLAKELQAAVRERTAIGQKLRKLRKEIRKNDEDVKLAFEDFSVKRRKTFQVVNQTAAPKLKQKWKTAKQKLSQEINRLLEEDPQLIQLRDQRSKLNEEVKALRQRRRDKPSDSIARAVANAAFARTCL